MTILEKIVAFKKTEVEAHKLLTTTRQLEAMPNFDASIHLLSPILKMGKTAGVIAEFKRRSPSKDVINATALVDEVTKGYMDAGASALSILTDAKYFGGALTDLSTARQINSLPILRKDFIIDEWQILQARAHGADIILLIAECLTKAEVKNLASVARSLHMDVLLEMHSETELVKISPDITMVGINNRDLKTFAVDIERSIRMLKKLPTEVVRIAESGINDPNTVIHLREAGFQGFLIGECFMKEADPAQACKEFIVACKPKKKA